MPKYTDNNATDYVFERLTPASLEVLKRAIAPSGELLEANLSDLITAINAIAPAFLSLLEKLELPKVSKRKVEVSEWLVDAYSEAYLAESENVDINHLVFAFLLNYDSELYYQAKKEYIKSSRIGDKSGLKAYYENISENLPKTHLKILGREKELTRIIVNLSAKSANPTLLVGDSGSGKTSLIFELAQRIKSGKVPAKLLNSDVVRVSFPRLLSLIPADSNVSAHLLFSHLINSIAEMSTVEGHRIILFIDDIRLSSNVLFGFETVSKSEDIMIIGAIEEDFGDKPWEPVIFNMWDVVTLGDIDQNQELKILKSYAKSRYAGENVKFEDESIAKIISSHKEDLTLPSLPGGGIKTIDLLAVYKKHILTDYTSTKSAADAEIVITQEDVSEFFSISEDQKEKELFSNFTGDKLLNLEKTMKKQIIGQEEALEALARALRISSMKLYSKTRPIGTFLFLGPTGVGKTETAKVLASVLFGYRDSNKHHPSNFLRVDMSEYAEKHTVSKLFGAPPGYIGYDDSSSLTDFVYQNPNCVILFDEIDKAHPEVLNSLLHIMDEGEIRNNQGAMISFEEVIVVMTSNHGAELINKLEIGLSDKSEATATLPDTKDKSHALINRPSSRSSVEIEKKLLSNLKKQLKPEFINRFDEIIVFKQLDLIDLDKILKIMIKDLVQNLNKREVKLNINSKARELIVQKAYSKEYGARELRRVFNKEIVEGVSKILLSNLKTKTIAVTVKGKEIVIKAE